MSRRRRRAQTRYVCMIKGSSEFVGAESLGGRCRFCGNLEVFERVLHGEQQLAAAVGRHVDDTSPRGYPVDGVGLGDPGPTLRGLEDVTPLRRARPPSSVTKANSRPVSARSARPGRDHFIRPRRDCPWLWPTKVAPSAGPVRRRSTPPAGTRDSIPPCGAGQPPARSDPRSRCLDRRQLRDSSRNHQRVSCSDAGFSVMCAAVQSDHVLPPCRLRLIALAIAVNTSISYTTWR